MSSRRLNRVKETVNVQPRPEPARPTAVEAGGEMKTTTKHIPLLDSKMGIYGGVTGSAGQIFVFAIGNMLTRATVSVLFGKTEVDEEKLQKPKECLRQCQSQYSVSISAGQSVHLSDCVSACLSARPAVCLSVA